MRVLVLGSSGFVGRHVARELVQRGHAVEGWSRRPAGDAALARERAIDLRDARALDAAGGSWDAAVLLAGQAVPGPAFGAQAAEDNVNIARNALAFLARTSSGARVLLMSSAHVYGAGSDAGPLEERREPAPAGPYGASKLAVEALAREHAPDLDVVVARSFNQIGPSMPPGLLIPDLLERLRDGADPVAMNGQDGLRDFLDARDAARAIADLVALPDARGRTFNVCSGTGVRVSDLARRLMQRLCVRREVRFAPGTPAAFVGSRAALTRATGWSPRIDLDRTLDWVVAETARSA